MSVVIGMHLGAYVLLAADTRVTFFPDETGPAVFRDDRVKVRKTRMGIMAGVGLSQLLDGVQARLEREDPGDTDRIIAIIQDEREKVPEDWFTSPRVRNAVDNETCWLFTYVNSTQPDTPTLDTWRLRLALAHPHSAYRLALCSPGSGSICMPVSVPGAGELQDTLHRNLRPLDDLRDLQSNVEHHVGLCSSLIRHIAAVETSVSAYVHVGLHIVHPAVGAVVEIVAPRAV